MAENVQSATETDSTRENRKWNLSWIIASLVAVVVGAILAWSGLDMIPSILIVTIGWVLATALLWLMTPARLHTLLKVSASLILMICALLSVQWIYRFDRPILSPEIGGLVTQNYNGNDLSIDVETLVKNTGRQSGYADSWRLDLLIDGAIIQGRELYGERLPEQAANEPAISDQEFSPGKPVHGWLFFAFPGVSHDYASTYFTCGSPLMDKVSVRLLVWDSKMKHEWSQVRSLKDMGKEACSPLAVAPPASAVFSIQEGQKTKAQVKQQSQKQTKTPSQQPTPQPTVTNNAPGGFAVSGGTLTNPTVNNFAPPQRTISKEQLDNLRLALAGTTGSVSSNCPMSDDEGCAFAESIRQAFDSVGWNAGPHVGLTAPTGKKQPFVYVGLVDPYHLSTAENLVMSGLKSMNIPIVMGHSNDARGIDVPIFIDATIVPFKAAVSFGFQHWRLKQPT
jgi:hypothetical protein